MLIPSCTQRSMKSGVVITRSLERKKKQSDEVMPTETSAENKEEAQPVNTRKGYYPDDIAGSFGVPVEQHRQESEVRQMDGYVSVGMLTGLPGQQQNT